MELDKEGDSVTTATGATARITEPEPEEEDKGGRYMLLERLFRFVRTKDTPVNPVLSGYFSKLVTLLINRKQKMLIPYVFQQGSDVLECLLFHVY